MPDTFLCTLSSATAPFSGGNKAKGTLSLVFVTNAAKLLRASNEHSCLGDVNRGFTTPIMLTLSLLLNIVVLVPVCLGLIKDAKWTNECYGPASAARGILLSVYVAIGVVSAMLLVMNEPKLVAALLLVQVIYKVTTPLTVGTLRNPVVASNLGIAAFHAMTVASIVRAEW